MYLHITKGLLELSYLLFPLPDFPLTLVLKHWNNYVNFHYEMYIDTNHLLKGALVFVQLL